MPIPGKVQITGVLAPTDGADNYPVTDPQYGLGALRTVADTAAMNAITFQRRQQGMLVYVVADLVYYMLNAPPWDGTLTDWTMVALGGGGASMAIGNMIGNGPIDGDTLVVGPGGVLAQADTMVTSPTAPLTLKSSGTPGNYTATNSGIFMKNAAGDEMLRIVAGDPNPAFTYGSKNLYIGIRAGQNQPIDNVDAGFFNIGIGYEALFSIITGAGNVAIGPYAIYAGTTTQENMALGTMALYDLVSGVGNVSVGNYSGSGWTAGNSNTFVGYSAGYDSTTTSNFSNTICIGNNTKVTASNRAVIGRNTVTDVYFGSESASAIIHAANYLGSAALTGVPTAPTAAVGTNTTQIATCAFVLANASTGTGGAGMAIGNMIGNGPVAGDTLVVGPGGVLAQTDTMVTSATGSPLTLRSSGTPGTYTDINTGIFMYDALGDEILRIVANDGSVALGVGAHVGGGEGGNNVAIGHTTTVDSQYGIAVGYGAQAHSTGDAEGYGIAIGYTATVGGYGNTAVGYNAQATNTGDDVGYNSAFGFNAVVSGQYNTTIGYFSSVSGQYNTGLGYFTVVGGEYNTALGYQARADNGVDGDGYNLALGFTSWATGGYNTAVGYIARADGIYNTVLGYVVKAIGDNNIVIGGNIEITSPISSSIAIGMNANVTVSNRAVIGGASLTDIYCGSEDALATVHAASFVGDGSLLTGISGGGGMAVGGTITGGTAGRVLFEGPGPVLADDPAFQWDATNHRLGVGTTTPTLPVDLRGITNCLGVDINNSIGFEWMRFTTANQANLYGNMLINSYAMSWHSTYNFEFIPGAGSGQGCTTFGYNAGIYSVPYQVGISPQAPGQAGLLIKGVASQSAPLVALQGVSSMSTTRDLAYLDAGFVSNVDASYTGYVAIDAVDWQARRPGIRVASDGTQAVTTITLLGPHGGTRLASNSGAFDLSAADWFFRTLDGTNGTLTVSNEKVGQLFTLELLQDGTGSRTVSFVSFGTIFWMTAAGTAPTVASAANARTTLLFKRISAGTFLGWMTGPSSAAVTPGGADTQVQFNNAGAFGGDSGLTYNSTSDTLTTAKIAMAVHYGAWTTDTDASTVTLDLSVTDKHTLLATTAVGASRIIAFSNFTVGQVLLLEFIQAATGGPYTITFSSAIRWANGNIPSTSTTVNKADLFTIVRRADGTYTGALSIPNY